MSLRIGLVGAGHWATEHHLPAVAASRTARVTAIYDLDRERATRVAAEVGLGPEAVMPDVEALAGDVDAAIIASPHPTHAAAARTLLRAGVPVLVEKPLTTAFADAAELVRLSEQLDVPVMVGYTSQFSRAAAQVQAWLADLGAVAQSVIEFHSALRPTLAASAGVEGPDPGWTPADAATYSLAGQGGQGNSQLSHAIGMFTWATGDQGAELFAYGNFQGLDVDVDDVLAMRTRAGSTVTAATSGSLPPGVPARQNLRFVAEGGVVDFDIGRARASLMTPDGMTRRIAPADGELPYDTHSPVRQFLALLSGESDRNPAPIRPAAAAVAILDAMHRSIGTGTSTAVPFLDAP